MSEQGIEAWAREKLHELLPGIELVVHTSDEDGRTLCFILRDPQSGATPVLSVVEHWLEDWREYGDASRASCSSWAR